jgi:hypothetical protein
LENQQIWLFTEQLSLTSSSSGVDGQHYIQFISNLNYIKQLSINLCMVEGDMLAGQDGQP